MHQSFFLTNRNKQHFALKTVVLFEVLTLLVAISILPYVFILITFINGVCIEEW